jgi:membrane-bound inhibitor of C-type lysozyme
MKSSRILSAVFAATMLAWIATASQAGGDPDGTIYDADSWKTMIPASCQSYFDGCNQCRRGETEATSACTRKACAVYQKPRCTDEPIMEGSMGGPPFAGKLVNFSCDEGAKLRVYYQQYVSGDMLVALAEDEIMLVDQQTHSAHRLRQQRAASGAKYASDKLEFWEHGGEAMVRKDGERLYANCKAAS